MCACSYRGVDCKDQSQLVLIAGIHILGMVIAPISVRSKKKYKRDIEEQNSIENDFQNPRLLHTSRSSNPGAEVSIFPIFPKIRANSSKDSQLQNPSANHRGIPRPDD